MEQSVIDKDFSYAERWREVKRLRFCPYCYLDVLLHQIFRTKHKIFLLNTTFCLKKIPLGVPRLWFYYLERGSTRRAMMADASKANPRRIPVSIWIWALSGRSKGDVTLPSPVILVRFRLLQKLAPQNSRIPSTFVTLAVSIESTVKR